MIAVARGRYVIFVTGPVGAALAHVLEKSGRSMISVPVNEYGSDSYGVAIMRGDQTDLRPRALTPLRAAVATSRSDFLACTEAMI